MNRAPEVAAERIALAVDVLRCSGRLRLQVHGESMLPTLWPRDVVKVVRCSIADVRPGEIVLAVREGRFFLHRFLGRCPLGGFLLKGDSMPAADPRFSDDALIGRVLSRAGSDGGHRRVERVPVQTWPPRRHADIGQILSLGLVNWVLGRLICYCGLARRLALKIHALRVIDFAIS
jgi:hypothetical protein